MRWYHPGGTQGANLKSICHRCYLREVAFECELTKKTIYLPLGCLQGGSTPAFERAWDTMAASASAPDFDALVFKFLLSTLAPNLMPSSLTST